MIQWRFAADDTPKSFEAFGPMLVYFAIILIGLLGFCGLVIDVGRIELRSLQIQAATDSAAISAASEYQRTSNFAAAQSAAQAEIASTAALNNIPAATPTTTPMATAGAYMNDGSTVQVSATQPVSTTLLSLIAGHGSALNAKATSVAMIPPCIYLMGNPSYFLPGAPNLWLASEGFNLTCPMYSTGTYIVDFFSHINGWQAKTSSSVPTYGGGGEYPAVILNSPVLSDPLSYIAAPTFSSCTYTNKSYTIPTTISPGTYCGTLKVTGTTVTMLPGLYIITGGVDISYGSTVNGTGVTIYLTQGGGSGFGTFQLRDFSNFNVSAPTDSSGGGIPAILIMTDRTWTGGLQDISIVSSTVKGDGILYITGTGIYSWFNQISGYNYFSFVSANMYMFATNLVLSSNYSQLPGGSPFHTAIALVQ